MLPTLSPLALKERASIAFVYKGRLDVLDGAFVMVDKTGTRIHIPVGSVACIMLEPGTRVSHAAVALAARAGTLLVWVGEAGVRLYAAGQPGGARADRLLYQASLALDPDARLAVVRKMFAIRFGEDPPPKRSVDQLRGIEGTRVRSIYSTMAKQYKVPWEGRKYDPNDWGSGDIANRALSTATAALYGLCEAAILAAGYAPAIGFLHTGKPLSFVYDIADIFKFDTVVPVAFQAAAKPGPDLEGVVRRHCRDAFRKSKLLKTIIPTIHDILAASGKPLPQAPQDAVKPTIPEKQGLNDDGHRC